jgi:hypothetical protein
VLANCLGGSGEFASGNIFPVDHVLNNGRMKSHELRVKRQVLDYGEVCIFVYLLYNCKDESQKPDTRPGTIVYVTWVGDDEFSEIQIFNNAPTPPPGGLGPGMQGPVNIPPPIPPVRPED